MESPRTSVPTRTVNHGYPMCLGKLERQSHQQKAGASQQVLMCYHKLKQAITPITATVLETAPLYGSELSKPQSPCSCYGAISLHFSSPIRKVGMCETIWGRRTSDRRGEVQVRPGMLPSLPWVPGLLAGRWAGRLRPEALRAGAGEPDSGFIPALTRQDGTSEPG